ncbi:unnamed protein product [Allacma fusca]|uniref:26S proteasome regulatory subunit Rpn7 N-terminal domain-containing protein n=1 Tax=Allacma fusca TaxID=39272 RepID=A0A8J2L8W1_9HEXA|nr:unnamed protein product [Allacma fusca]
MELAQLKFILEMGGHQRPYIPDDLDEQTMSCPSKVEVLEKLLAAIENDKMAPFYKELCKNKEIVAFDVGKLESMEKLNQEKIQDLDEKTESGSATGYCLSFYSNWAYYMVHYVITRNIEKAKTLIDVGGDWDRRNRLKVYPGTYAMVVRDFKTAAEQFLDTM